MRADVFHITTNIFFQNRFDLLSPLFQTSTAYTVIYLYQSVYISLLRQDALAKIPENKYHGDTYIDLLPGIENYRNVI